MSDNTNSNTCAASSKGRSQIRSIFKSSAAYVERLSHLIKKDTSSAKQNIDQYNVLVIGETQSGKSTLIQYMRKYANPYQKIDTSAIGTGYLSHSTKVANVSITTNLPEYYISDTKDPKIRLDYEEFINIPCPYEYEDAINMRKGLTMIPGEPLLDKEVNIKLVDTPGLNATLGDDEANIQKIFDALIDAKSIHLILITVSSGPFTHGLQDAIQAYLNMFPGFNGIIAFVHTHFDYKYRHPANPLVSNAIDRRTQSLHKIMRRTSFAHFKIDCDIYNKKAIRECITQNTIQKILALATLNQPIDMLHTVINKTRKMRDIDNILRDKFEATSLTIEKTLRFNNKEEGDLLAQIYRNETTVHKLEAQIKVLDEFFARHDVELLEILHEERINMDYEVDDQGKSISIRYPKTGESEFAIKRRDLLLHGVKLIDETPTDDMQQLWVDNSETPWGAWEGTFERTSQQSVLHVKIYATKSSLNQDEINRKRAEYNQLKQDLVMAKMNRDSHAYENESKRQEIKTIVDRHSECIQVLGFVANHLLSAETFNALIAANAYIGNTAECAKKVEAVYMALAKADVDQKTVS